MRPLFPGERSIDFAIHENEITVHPSCGSCSSFCIDKLFSFRTILNHTSTQSQVFETVAAPLLEEFLHGSDALIFCYGSTNAGKTYTVSGSDQNPGILKRSLETVVQGKNSNQSLHVSFIEIYNEIIYDLLDPAKQKESKRLGVNEEGEIEVKNLVEIEITSLEDATAAFRRGEVGRHRGFTEFNAESSRSHTICQLKLSDRRKHCYLSIVDLAGCERLSIMNSTAGSFREACNINKSMLVLGKCIRQMKERSATGKRNPASYRESKLTYLFKSFFEPTRRPSHAAIVINVSPSHLQLEDTIFALQFAAEASQCVIRQTTVLQEEEEEEEEEEMEDFETQIRKKVRQEMEEVLVHQQQHMEENIEKLNMRCGSLCLSHFPQFSNITSEDGDGFESTLQTLTDDNQQLEAKLEELQVSIVEKEKEFSSIQQDLIAAETENAALRKSIDEVKHRIEIARSGFRKIDIIQFTESVQTQLPSLPSVSEELFLPPPIDSKTD
jgi:hypothetical protein